MAGKVEGSHERQFIIMLSIILIKCQGISYNGAWLVVLSIFWSTHPTSTLISGNLFIYINDNLFKALFILFVLSEFSL